MMKEGSDDLERRIASGEAITTRHPDESVIVEMGRAYGEHAVEDIAAAEKAMERGGYDRTIPGI